MPNYSFPRAPIFAQKALPARAEYSSACRRHSLTMAKVSSWLKWMRDGRVELLLAGGGAFRWRSLGPLAAERVLVLLWGVACQCRSRKPLAVKRFPMLLWGGCVFVVFSEANGGEVRSDAVVGV